MNSRFSMFLNFENLVLKQELHLVLLPGSYHPENSGLHAYPESKLDYIHKVTVGWTCKKTFVTRQMSVAVALCTIWKKSRVIILDFRSSQKRAFCRWPFKQRSLKLLNDFRCFEKVFSKHHIYMMGIIRSSCLNMFLFFCQAYIFTKGNEAYFSV